MYLKQTDTERDLAIHGRCYEQIINLSNWVLMNTANVRELKKLNAEMKKALRRIRTINNNNYSAAIKHNRIEDVCKRILVSKEETKCQRIKNSIT